MSKTATYTTDATNGTLTVTWTNLKTKMNRILGDTSKALYNRGYGDHTKLYVNMTIQDKADILLDFYTKETKIIADGFHVNEDTGGVNDVITQRTAELNGTNDMGV